MTEEYEQAPEGVEAEISPDIGEADGDTQATEIIEAPPIEYLDIDDTIAIKHVKIERDGQEISVPLREAIDGYNVNSVATQRFQEASVLRQEAEQAVRLQQAMQANPGLTIQYLAQQAGVGVQEFLGMAEAQQVAAAQEVSEDQYVDPLEQQLAEERNERLSLQSRFEQREADEELSRAVGGLKSQFQIDDDQARAVVGRALQMGVGPDMFSMIYQSMAYQAGQQAQQQSASNQQAEQQRRSAAVAQQAAVVGTAQSAVGTTTNMGNQTFSSIREAVMGAYEQVERSAR